MKKELTCIVCPMGCHLSVELDEAGLVASVEILLCIIYIVLCCCYC